jgi:hypothetical protein
MPIFTGCNLSKDIPIITTLISSGWTNFICICQQFLYKSVGLKQCWSCYMILCLLKDTDVESTSVTERVTWNLKFETVRFSSFPSKIWRSYTETESSI